MDHIKNQTQGLLKRTYQPIGDSNGVDSYEMPKSTYAPNESQGFTSPVVQDAAPYSNYTETFPPATPQPSYGRAQFWRPRFFGRLPFLGIIALSVAFIWTVAAAIVLLRSDGQELDKWNPQPSVIVSIASTIFQIALGCALAEGAIIFWWNRGLGGSTVRDLQRVWEYGQSLPAALCSGKHVNLLAIATIIVTSCAAVGPLLQSASSVVVSTTTSPVKLTGHVASELPQGFSASFATQSSALGGLSLEFSNILADFEQNTPIVSDLTLCEGNCSAVIDGAGITAVCGAPIVSDWGINRTSDSSGIPIFQVNSTWENNGAKADGISLEQITLEIGIAGNIQSHPYYEPGPVEPPTQNCTGQYTSVTCILSQNTVAYPVAINNGIITLNATNPNLTVVSPVPKYGWSSGTEGGYAASTIGGLAIYLSDRASANVSLTQSGVNRYPPPANFPSNTAMSNYTMNSFDTFAAQFFTSSNITTDRCDYTWKDPTDNILQALNEIMLRAMLQAGKNNPNGIMTGQLDAVEGSAGTTHPTDQTITAMQTTTKNMYHTDRLFMILGLALMLAGLISVLPIYAGFWRLGRKMSFNPIEVARAFDAPILEGEGLDNRQVVFTDVGDGIGGRKMAFTAPGRIRRPV